MKGWGLIQKKECWGLTVKGWFLALASALLLIYFLIISLYGFLALHQPVNGDLLVVEGWLPDFAAELLVEEVQMENYKMIVTAGGKRLKGAFLTDYLTTADQLAETLIMVGMDPDKIQVVRNPSSKKDRTYSSALEVYNWLLQSDLEIKAIDIVTVGPHARRSKLLFEMAFDNKLQVGVINIQDINYSPENWRSSSTGVRTVLGELIAYIYAKFIFYPRTYE